MNNWNAFTRAGDELQRVAEQCLAKNERMSLKFWQARARVFHLAAELLQEMDPRYARIAHMSLGGMLAGALGAAVSPGLEDMPSDDGVWSAMWARNNFPTFVLTSSLAANLLLTDPGRVSMSDVGLPFPAFRIVLPYPDCGIDFTHADGVTLTRTRAINVLDWIGLSRSEKGREPPIITADLHEAETVEQFQRVLHRVLTQAIAAVEQTHDQRMFLVRGYANDGIAIHKNMEWHDNQPVSAWFEDVETQIAPEEQAHIHTSDRDQLASSMMQRLAINLSLWLGTTSKPTNKRVWEPSMRTQGHGRMWTVGRDVRLSKEVREAATLIAAGRSASAPSVRHIVRGHFRNQACGEGRHDRERIYVQPFWRGPEEGTTRERVYRAR